MKILQWLFAFCLLTIASASAALANGSGEPKITIIGLYEKMDTWSGGINTSAVVLSGTSKPSRTILAASVNTEASVHVIVDGPPIYFNWFTITNPQNNTTTQKTYCYVTIDEATAEPRTEYFTSASSKSYDIRLTPENNGTTYSVYCAGLSHEVTVGGWPCEAWFDQINRDLDSNKVTLITEESLTSWTEADEKDRCGYDIQTESCNKRSSETVLDYYSASGDKGDIETAMFQDQICQVLDGQEGRFLELSSAAASIKPATDSGFPVILVLGSYGKHTPLPLNQFNWIHDGVGHAVIALDVREKTTGGFTDYTFKVLDPNGPEIIEIECEEVIPNVMTYQESADGPVLNLPSDHICEYNEWSFGIYRYSLEEERKAAFASYCRQSPGAKYCLDRGYVVGSNPVQANLTDWLASNLPSISNPPIDGGVCLGWSNFVLKAAYLGNFLGEECPR